MLRRLTASLVLCLGLVGVGLPVLACSATAALDEECCSQGAQFPCTDNEVDYGSAAVVSCCAAAPAPYRSSVDAGRSADRKHDSGSPDASALPVWMACASVADPPDVTAPNLSAHRADAALTYLRTGRLRL